MLGLVPDLYCPVMLGNVLLGSDKGAFITISLPFHSFIVTLESNVTAAVSVLRARDHESEESTTDNEARSASNNEPSLIVYRKSAILFSCSAVAVFVVLRALSSTMVMHGTRDRTRGNCRSLVHSARHTDDHKQPRSPF
jgi:hypothetical protein